MDLVQFQEFQGALCVICGDISSGNHYGVKSCEGCKGFFKRYVRGLRSEGSVKINKCINTLYPGGCSITRNTRNQCQECRLNKCLEAGMDANNVQQARPWAGSPSDLVYYGSTSNDSIVNDNDVPLPIIVGCHQSYRTEDQTNVANSIPRKRSKIEVEENVLLPFYPEVVVQENEHGSTTTAYGRQSYSNSEEMLFGGQYEDTLGGGQVKIERLESEDTFDGAQVKIERLESESEDTKANIECGDQVVVFEPMQYQQKNLGTEFGKKAPPKKRNSRVIISKESIKFQYPLTTAVLPIPVREFAHAERFRSGVEMNLLSAAVTWAVGLPALHYFTFEEKMLLLSNCWKDLYLLRLVQNHESFQDTLSGVANQNQLYFTKAPEMLEEAQTLRKFLDDGVQYQLSDFEFASLNAMKLFNFELIPEHPKFQQVVEVLHRKTCTEYVDRSEMFRGQQHEAYTKKLLNLKTQLKFISTACVKWTFFGDYLRLCDVTAIENLIRGIIKVHDSRQ